MQARAKNICKKVLFSTKNEQFSIFNFQFSIKNRTFVPQMNVRNHEQETIGDGI